MPAIINGAFGLHATLLAGGRPSTAADAWGTITIHAFRPETVADDRRPCEAGSPCPPVWACLRWRSGSPDLPFLGASWPGCSAARSNCSRRWSAAGAAILLRAWLDHHRTMIAHRTAARVQETLRGRLFDKIVALGPAWFGAERTGGVMLSMVDGVEQLQSFFGQYLPQVTIAVCAPVAIFVFIAWWDVPVAAVMLAAALFTLVLPATVHRKTARASRARQSAFKSFGEEFLDAVQGLPTLKAFGQSAAYGRMLAAKARALSDSTFWVLALNVLTRGFTDLGTALGVRRGAGAGRLARPPWRHEPGRAADRADGGDRDLPPAARPARRAASGPERPGGGDGHHRAAGHAGGRRRDRRRRLPAVCARDRVRGCRASPIRAAGARRIPG